MDANIPAIELKQLSCSIPVPDGIKRLLRGIELTVAPGEWLGIAGTNGSGKSTLAKAMARLIPPASGEVLYRCDRIHTAGPAQETEAGTKPFVQMIFQNPDTQMLGETVYEDVCFGLDNYGFPVADRHRLAMDALERTGLAALADSPARFLSGGQKQLLHVAGCLAVQPDVLIFDEATAMLDPLSRQRLLQTVRQLHSAGTTVVWITQLMDELSECGRIVAMDEGRIVFDGSKEAFFYGEGGAVFSGAAAGDEKAQLPAVLWGDGFEPSAAASAAKAGATVSAAIPGVGVSVTGPDAAVSAADPAFPPESRGSTDAMIGKTSAAAEDKKPPLPVCEQLGFPLPYAVRVAQAMIRQGCTMHPLPFTIEQLGKAVNL